MSQTELVTIPAQTALQVFTTDGAMEPFLARVRQEIDGFTPDITTAKGRKAVAAMAYKVSQTKSYLEGVGKALAAEQKLIPGKIDACRARVRNTLDGWRDEVRKPLTDWELAEEARVFRHRSAIAEMYGQPAAATSAEEIAAAIASTEAFVIGPDLEEFTAEYAMAKDTALRELRAKLVERQRLDAEEAERARLQREAEERAAAEREERIRAEAVAAERARAEREAAEERDRVEREAAAERRRVEAEAARVEAAAQAERDAADRRERDLRLQAEEANRRAAETELRVKREAEDEAKRIADEAARREADTRRRGKVNREAVAALVACGVPEELAKLAVTMIARRAVPHVAITY
jgi:colicin import membrane protein